MKPLGWVFFCFRMFIQPFCLCYRQNYSMDISVDIVWGYIGMGILVFPY